MKTHKVGIIAEDECDVDCAQVLIRRITSKKISTAQFVGKGCGKIKRKSFAWAKNLQLKGCSSLIIIHDSDGKSPTKILNDIQSAINPCPIKKNLICIPIQELEAWLLSDPKGIQKGLNLRKEPKIIGQPQNINSPKEYLGKIVKKASNNEKIYLNTRHNALIVKYTSLENIRKKCTSFRSFYEFVKNL